MTQTIRQVIDAALDSWLHDDHNRSPTRTDAILAALELAGIGTYDMRTHAAVPREPTSRVATAMELAPAGETDAEFWHNAWTAGITAADADAREAGDE